MSTGIEWSDETWNPLVGCSHVSEGCDNCYAATLASTRLAHLPDYAGLAVGGRFTGEVRLRPERLDLPLRWRKPRRVFVDSMSDLFHSFVPVDYIARVFAVMATAQRHQFQILTKRPGRMRALVNRPGFYDQVMDEVASSLDLDADSVDLVQRRAWPLANVWLGVSVENQKWADVRIPELVNTPAAVRFLSCEPLLGPLDLTRIATHSRGPVAHWEGRDQVNALTGQPRDPQWHVGARVDWVIAGGESGSAARPMHPDWVRALRDQCRKSPGVSFLFKQWGEWAPEGPPSKRPVAVANDGTVYQPGELTYPDGPRYGEAVRARHDKAHLTAMYRVGTKPAGRELDGRTWDEYPADRVGARR